MRRFLPALLVLLLLAAPSARADEGPYRRYTSADGLPHEDVLALAQSADGRLYVGTPQGLAIYDGERFRTVPFPDSVGGSPVEELLARPDSTVWAATGNGHVVQVHGPRVLRTVRVADGIQRLLARQDTLYVFTTSAGYWTLAPGAERPTRHPYSYPIRLWRARGDTTSGRGVRDAALSPSGDFWILDGRRGPARLEPDGALAFAGVQEAPKKYWWNKIRFVAPGRAVLSTGSTVTQFNTRTGQLALLSGENEGYLATYRRNGHTVYLHGSARRRLPENARLPGLAQLGLPVNNVRRALIDHEGSLWLGTPEGLFQLYAPGVRQVRRIGETALSNVGTLSIGPGGTLWASSWGSGLLRIRPRPAAFRPHGETRWSDVVSQSGRVHALSAAGWYRHLPGAGWQRVGAFQEGIRGVVGPGGRGYFWHDDGLYRHARHAPGPPDSLHRWPTAERDLNAVGPHRQGGVVLRSQDRLYRIRPGSSPGSPPDSLLQPVARLPGYEEARGRYLEADRRGLVWLAFWERGLLRLDTRRTPARQDSMLVGRPLRRVAISGDSLVFATAQDGLYVVEAESGRLRRHLTPADGLLGNTTTDALIHDDTLYISHPLGLTKMPADALLRSHPPPEALLTRLERGREAVAPQAPPRFDAGDRTVSFHFAATTFKDPKRVRYEYRLAPHDTTWTAGNEGFTRYTDLPPGDYRFAVRARRAGGSFGEAATYAFTIPRYFYETTWFRLLCILAMALAGVGAYRWRVRALRRRQHTLEEKVGRRTAQLRREKQRTEAQAERLAELDAAKNRFFANLSHEFRTPLTLILGPLKGALEESNGDLPDEHREQLGLMQRSARRLQRLIGQLLDLTKLEAGRMNLQRRRGDLAAFTERLAERFTPMAEREQIALQFRPQADRLPACFDPDKLEQILSNLLSNALKFTPEGGNVWVTVGRAGDSSSAEITVKDTGPGLSEKDLRRIFDRFEQVNGSATREHEGTGLGLALARELVELHGGRIMVESEPGFGTAFTVRLPVGERESGRVGAWEDGEPKIEGGKRTRKPRRTAAPRNETREEEATPRNEKEQAKILIVEDNADVRAYLRRHLEEDYAVAEAADGAAGLEAARIREPDLVLSDVMMPGMDGCDLCKAIKADEALGATPVLLLTAKAGASDAIEGLECGADDYVTKPFDIGELQARIDRLLASRRRLRERFSAEVRVAPTGATTEADNAPFLKRLTAAANEHLAEPAFGVDDLAAEMALSRRQLTRRCKEAAGETPAALIRRLRLERAAGLLAEQEDVTVAEVAYAVGYSTSHFAEAFRKRFGCAPSDYEGDGAA